MTVEELAKYDAGVSITLSADVSLCANPIYEFGTDAQKEKYLKPLCEGTMLGAFALTEPNAGTDAAGQQTVAAKEGDHYVLNGSKIFITNGGAADVYIVFAMTDKSQERKVSAHSSSKKEWKALLSVKRR